jgi:hypothetical protein
MELVIIILSLLILISVMYVKLIEYIRICKSTKEYALSLKELNKLLKEKNDILESKINILESIIAAHRDVQIVSDEVIDAQNKLLALYERNRSYSLN